MRRIYVFCDAGMSTKLLVNRMQIEADNSNISIIIEAFPFSKSFELIKGNVPDCILLGPQVRFLLGDLVDICSEMDIPIDVINSNDYGTMNGKSVLKHAISMIKKR